MPTLTTSAKIQEFFESQVLSQLENWTEQLVAGDLLGFEQRLGDQLTELHNKVCDELLPSASEQVFGSLKTQAKAEGCRKMVRRGLKIRMSTGHFVEVENPYVKQPPDDFTGERHLVNAHWNVIGGASPGLYDRVGFCAAMAPSFDAGYQLLEKFGTSICLSSVQKMSQELADKCHEVGEAQLSLKAQESVAHKTVIIGIDGASSKSTFYPQYQQVMLVKCKMYYL